MDSAQNERLNVFGAIGIAIGVAVFVASAWIDATIPLVIAAAVAIASGVIAVALKRPGKELGYVAIVLGVVAALLSL